MTEELEINRCRKCFQTKIILLDLVSKIEKQEEITEDINKLFALFDIV